MHDIDSTRLEAGPAYGELADQQEYESHEGEGEESYEMPMTEAEEEALAAELLGVSSEMEMEQFLGSLFRKIKKRLGGAAKFLSQNAGPLVGALKGIASQSLPFLSGALGTAIPIPGLGTALGTVVGKAANDLLQSEMENLEAEEQEFEMARRYVRLASQAVRHAARIPTRSNPSVAVNYALRNAFRRLRGRGGFRPRPIYYRAPVYPACPPPEPCPVCPACSQLIAAVEPSPPGGAPGVAGVAPVVPGGPVGTSVPGELEWEEAGEAGEFEGAGEFENVGEGEGEGEGENYESDPEISSAPVPGDGRAGRWVRRGRKIVIYGV